MFRSLSFRFDLPVDLRLVRFLAVFNDILAIWLRPFPTRITPGNTQRERRDTAGEAV